MNKEIKFLMYSAPQGDVNVEAVVKDETLWLTQKAMAQLFGVQVPAISRHLKNIYAEGELLESTTISKMETVVQRGFRGGVEEMLDFYNLDAIISVGYRVNSAKATHFRIWATKVLKEYMIKGFVLDDERLKQGGQTFGKITIPPQKAFKPQLMFFPNSRIVRTDKFEDKKARKVFQLSPLLYPEPGSNRHGSPHWCLRPARLPIPPSGQILHPQKG